MEFITALGCAVSKVLPNCHEGREPHVLFPYA